MSHTLVPSLNAWQEAKNNLFGFYSCLKVKMILWWNVFYTDVHNDVTIKLPHVQHITWNMVQQTE